MEILRDSSCLRKLLVLYCLVQLHMRGGHTDFDELAHSVACHSRPKTYYSPRNHETDRDTHGPSERRVQDVQHNSGGNFAITSHLLTPVLTKVLHIGAETTLISVEPSVHPGCELGDLVRSQTWVQILILGSRVFVYLLPYTERKFSKLREVGDIFMLLQKV